MIKVMIETIRNRGIKGIVSLFFMASGLLLLISCGGEEGILLPTPTPLADPIRDISRAVSWKFPSGIYTQDTGQKVEAGEGWHYWAVSPSADFTFSANALGIEENWQLWAYTLNDDGTYNVIHQLDISGGNISPIVIESVDGLFLCQGDPWVEDVVINLQNQVVIGPPNIPELRNRACPEDPAKLTALATLEAAATSTAYAQTPESKQTPTVTPTPTNVRVTATAVPLPTATETPATGR